MTRNDLTNEWAWSRIEAAADGSLSTADKRRMREAMRSDLELHAAVDRAALLRRELGRLGAEPVPAGLRRRLLDVAAPARRAPRPHSSHGLSLVAPATAVAAVLAVAGMLAMRPPTTLPAPPRTAATEPASTSTAPPAPQPSASQERAVQEFRVAINYIQRSAAATSEGVAREVAHGVRQALAVSRSAVFPGEFESASETENGG